MPPVTCFVTQLSITPNLRVASVRPYVSPSPLERPPIDHSRRGLRVATTINWLDRMYSWVRVARAQRRDSHPRFWRSQRFVPSHHIVSQTMQICWLPRPSPCHAVLCSVGWFEGDWVQDWERGPMGEVLVDADSGQARLWLRAERRSP